MSTISKIYFLFFFSFLFLQNVEAQFYPEYKTAIGARIGSPYLAVSYKTFISERNAIEGYVGYRDFANASWVSATGAFQRHHSLHKLTNGLLWYYGGGTSIYFWSFDSNFTGTETSTAVGANAYLGLDYRLPNTRFVFSADWAPTYIFNGSDSGFAWDYGGVGVRYVWN